MEYYYYYYFLNRRLAPFSASWSRSQFLKMQIQSYGNSPASMSCVSVRNVP